MADVNLLDLVHSDTFCEIQVYLGLKDLFVLRCVSKELRDYLDVEIVKLKSLRMIAKDVEVGNAFKFLCNKCYRLETINLSTNKWLNDEHLIPMLKNNGNTLKSLHLNNCPNLTSVALHSIIDCKKLKKLSLHNCYWLTTGCLETIAFHHNSLEELDLTNCSSISERCLILLLNSFRKLRVLSLASVTSVNDKILFYISKYLSKSIIHLNLFSCHLITDRGISHLSTNCKNLETLSIRGCSEITDRSLTLLRSKNVHIDVPRHRVHAFVNQIPRFDRFNVLHLQV